VMVKQVEEGRYQTILEDLMKAEEDKLKKLYTEREIEPAEAEEDWVPKDTQYL